MASAMRPPVICDSRRFASSAISGSTPSMISACTPFFPKAAASSSWTALSAAAWGRASILGRRPSPPFGPPAACLPAVAVLLGGRQRLQLALQQLLRLAQPAEALFELRQLLPRSPRLVVGDGVVGQGRHAAAQLF